MRMTRLPICKTSYAYARGACAAWLNGDTVCSQPSGHWPQTNHRGYDPSGSGKYIEYGEIDGKPEEIFRSWKES
jgi:hypothetical protein